MKWTQISQVRDYIWLVSEANAWNLEGERSPVLLNIRNHTLRMWKTKKNIQTVDRAAIIKLAIHCANFAQLLRSQSKCALWVALPGPLYSTKIDSSIYVCQRSLLKNLQPVNDCIQSYPAVVQVFGKPWGWLSKYCSCSWVTAI